MNFKPAKDLSNSVNKKYRNLTPNVLDELLTLTGVTKIKPDYVTQIKTNKDFEVSHKKAKKRAIFALIGIIVFLLLLLATLIIVPVMFYNSNNKVVQYVTKVNRMFGLNKLTDSLASGENMNEEEIQTFMSDAKNKLASGRKIIDTYVVKKGDNIYMISKKYYENEYLWPDLYIMNKNDFNDPDLIHEGDSLTIYEKLGDPEKFSNDRKRNIVESYIGIYRIYRALGEKDIAAGKIERGEKRKSDSIWTLYTAVRYDHNLIDKYKDAIYPEDISYIKKLIDKFGYKADKK